MIQQFQISCQTQNFSASFCMQDCVCDYVLLAASPQQISIHHGHVPQMKHQLVGPLLRFAVHLIAFENFVPKVNCLHAVIVIKNRIRPPVPFFLAWNTDQRLGRIVNGTDQVENFSVPNGHGQKLIALTPPPNNVF